jgi:hypothetical protein
MRLDGWERRLAAVIEAARVRPYELGVHDCASFAGECVKALDGRDLWGTHAAGRYRSRAEFVRLLRAQGRGGYAAAVSRLLGVEPQPVAFAQRGDVVELRRGTRSHLGVCVGTHAAMPKLDGLAFVPLCDCRQSWRI